MLRYFTIFLMALFAQITTGAQQNIPVAAYVSFRAETLTPRELSQQLTAGKSSEYDKVRSIFDWITENISYRSQMVSRRNASQKIAEDDTSASLKPLNERVSEIVLRNRLAVCDGYARLFKTLCDHAGIRSEIVTGFVRNQGRSSGRFQANHSWNAVMIESKWYLVDATWASGYVDRSGQFIRNYDAAFFLADPLVMLRTHYPENPFWTLTEKHKAPFEFQSQPLKYFTWHQYYIDSYFPKSGIIDVKAGVPVEIILDTKEKKNDLLMTTNPFAIATGGNLPADQMQRNFVIAGDKIKGTWMPGSDRPQWLYVALNGEVIMRYHLRYNSL